MMQLFSKTRYPILDRFLEIAVLILALFDHSLVGAQVAPSDFVSVWQTSEVPTYSEQYTSRDKAILVSITKASLVVSPDHSLVSL